MPNEPHDAAPPAADRKASWMELLQGGRAPYTILLNLGIGLHALDVFVVVTIMPSVVADIGGVSFCTWTSMLYMVGSICGAAADGTDPGRRASNTHAGVPCTHASARRRARL